MVPPPPEEYLLSQSTARKRPVGPRGEFNKHPCVKPLKLSSGNRSIQEVMLPKDSKLGFSFLGRCMLCPLDYEIVHSSMEREERKGRRMSPSHYARRRAGCAWSDASIKACQQRLRIGSGMALMSGGGLLESVVGRLYATEWRWSAG